MVIASALLLLVAVPESATIARAHATARVVAAEEIDFERPLAQLEEGQALIRLMSSRNVEDTMTSGGVSALQLIEFQ